MAKSNPWLIRAPLILVGIVVVGYLLLRLWVGMAIASAIAASPDNITYDSMFLRWSGDFGIEGVKGAHALPDGSEKDYTADKLVVHTPGLLWLAGIGFTDKDDALPDDIGFTVENFRLVDDDNTTPGNWSNLPFDAVGCGKHDLTLADLAEMGMGESKRNMTIRLTRLDDHASNFRFAVDSPGIGGTSMDMEIGIERPLIYANGPQGLLGAPIKAGSLTMSDGGFIAARNAWCAKRVGVAPAAFVAHHMQALDTRLAEQGMTLGVGALERYREWVEKGGTLKVVTVGDTHLTLGDLSGPNRISKMGAVHTGIRLDDGPLANFEVGTQPKIARAEEPAAATATPAVASTASTAAAAATPTAQAAPAATAATTAPAAAPAAPADNLFNRTRSANLTGTDTALHGRVVATGEAVPYAALEKHVGERVQITTKMGSVRNGTVLSSNSYQTNLKLDAEDGGFNLNVFADTVREVRLIPASN